MPRTQEQVDDDHGERLLRLEDAVGDIKVSTALTAQTLTNLTEKIELGFGAVNERLDRGASQFDAHEASIATANAEVAKLQALEQARLGRWSVVKKAAFPLMAAAAGVVATKTGESIWTWISNFFR